MKILALDLGTQTGWACGEPTHWESGVQVSDVRRGESPGMRYVRFNVWLDEMVAGRLKPDILVYEQFHMRGGAATEVSAGFATRVQEQAARLGIEHQPVHSMTLKKWTTGSGKADKNSMLEAVRFKWAPTCSSYDEADAVALLHYAFAHFLSGTQEDHP